MSLYSLPYYCIYIFAIFYNCRNPERKGKTLIDNLPELIAVCNGKKHLLTKMLKPELTDHQVDEVSIFSCTVYSNSKK